MKKLLKDELFDSSKKGEEKYTIFNPYFIEVMPHIIEFFKNLSSTELPNYIQSSINEGKKLEYKYLEIHPEEQFEYQSMCINWTEFIEIYKVLKSNPTLYFVEETKEYKALKQLMNNEDMFKTKKLLLKIKMFQMMKKKF